MDPVKKYLGFSVLSSPKSPQPNIGFVFWLDLRDQNIIVTLCLAAAIDAAEDPVRLRHVLLPRLERADESEYEQPKVLYERFVNALDELSDDTLRDLKEKALKVYPIIVKTLAFLLRKTSSQSVKTNP
ncbi:hypothetical protein IGI04_030408 [Brassica rapa subsp. trilocularis]|uniref:Uncharacterized protein n=1 Tax=Brassica rapa subsp. trilocularis TaxID=1813537 RepID=A0ABQ7LQN8_BRACM|nr:hypothetical protein IGI04_030408 [Brassica rapa subsp. trilocularis]